MSMSQEEIETLMSSDAEKSCKEMDCRKGEVVQIIGPVIDVMYDVGCSEHLPKINDIIAIRRGLGVDCINIQVIVILGVNKIRCILVDTEIKQYDGIIKKGDVVLPLQGKETTEEINVGDKKKDPSPDTNYKDFYSIFEPQDKVFREILEVVSNDLLAVALKNATEREMNLFQRQMSNTRRKDFIYTYERLGLTKIVDIEKSQKLIINIMKEVLKY